jgi:prevent-host-death family protein
MNIWPLQDAKNRLSEVVRLAMSEGEQQITVRGESAVTVISTEELNKLRGSGGSLAEFLRASPLQGLELPPLGAGDTQ